MTKGRSMSRDLNCRNVLCCGNMIVCVPGPWGAAKLGYQVVQRAMQLAPSELHFSIPLSYPYCPFSRSDIKTSGIA
jgi:hypothetical protein